MTRTVVMSLLAMLLASGPLSAQTSSPVVSMNVTLPGGETRSLTAPESGLATVKLPDGTEIGVRPTILDDRPWRRVVVTFFKLPSASHGTEELGAVEVRTGGPAVQASGTPAFKVAVSAVSAAAANPATQTR